MFWGLILEPRRRYTQMVKHSFHISMAALDIFSCTEEPCQLMLHFDDRNYLLCTLQKGQMIQCPLDLNFEAGDKVSFATNGNSNVHLTGYLADDSFGFEEAEEEEADIDASNNKKRKVGKADNQPPLKKSKTERLLDEADNYNSDDDESFTLNKLEEKDDSDEDDDVKDEDDEEDDDSDDEEDTDDEEDDDSDEEVGDSSDDDESSSLSGAEEEEAKPKINGVASKNKQKKTQKQSKQTEQKVKSPNKTPNKQEKTPKADNTQKGNKTPKDEIQKEGAVAKSPNQQANSPQKRVLEGGVMIRELKVGEGKVIKSGKLAQVYYEGRLKQNNKVFDKLKQGKGFKFRVGKQEVIKGWDVGVVGMKVGGVRRIICPPSMAYGQKGSLPQIPPNSTLVFDVELKNIH